MRKLIIAALAALVVGSTLTFAPPTLAGAKKAGGAAHAGGKRLTKLNDTLGLTDAQKAQIKPILLNAAMKTRALRQNTSLTPEAKKAQMKAIRKASMTQIAAILTPAQKKKLAAMQHHGKKTGAKPRTTA